jgi:hypothetical protein
MSSLVRRLGIENLELRRLLAAVNIPDDLSGPVGAEVATPVNIDNAAGVRGAEIRISYNPDIFTLDEDDITAGTSWEDADDTQVVASVDATAGTVVIFISSSTALPTGAGSLAVLGFRIRDEVAPDTESVIDLVEVSLNEGAISVTPAPISGTDSTDGLIVVLDEDPGQADRIAGTVFADTNADNTPSQFEGIPGVSITLVNVSTNATRVTTTGDDGQFEFLNVAAGNYRIVQTHPQAYIDGGTNEITAALAVGQNLANQNFREGGLRAAFLYNRLSTTSALPVGSDSWIDTLRDINVDGAEDTADNTQIATAQAFSLDVQAEAQSPMQATSTAVTTEQSDSTAVSSDLLMSGLPQSDAKDDDENQVLVDDAMSQTSLW